MSALDRIEQRLRCGEVLRYHTSLGGLLRRQDVAQHVYNLMWLATTLYADNPPRAVLLALLGHDAGERFTGDLPGNFKARLSEAAREEIDAVEVTLLKERTGYRGGSLTTFQEAVVDFVDKLDGLIFCLRELRMGNKMAQPIYNNYLRYTGDALDALIRIDTRMADATFDMQTARDLYAAFRINME